MSIKTGFKWLAGLAVFAALRRLVTMAISGTMVATDLKPMRQAVVELDIGGVDTWGAVESWANSVEPTRGTTPTSEEKGLDGNNHVGYGTRGNSTINMTIFATVDTTDPLYNLYTQIDQVVDVRWSQTGLANDLRFYTSQAVLTNCNPPSFDANSNMSMKFSITITAPDILMEVIPT